MTAAVTAGGDRILIPTSYFDGPLDQLPLGMPQGLSQAAGGGGRGQGSEGLRRNFPGSQSVKGGGAGGVRDWLSHAVSGPVMFGR